MPPKGKSAGKKTAKTYTSESLLLRCVTGIVLIALGVLVFLSLAVSMEGAAFSLIASAARGLAGGLSLGLAAFFIWSGVLCALSARQKMPWKPFVLALLVYLCVLCAVNLLSQVWDSESRTTYAFMEYIRLVNQRDALQALPDGFLQVIQRGYLMCRRTGAGGGALGILLAWPLWQGLGSIGGAIVSILAGLGLAFALTRVDLKQWLANLRARGGEKRARREQEQTLMAQQQAQWQREEQLRQQARQAAMVQQQAAAQQQPPVPESRWAKPGSSSYEAEAYQRRPAYEPAYGQEAYGDYGDFAPAQAEGFYQEEIIPAGSRPAMDWEGAMQRAKAPEKKPRRKEREEAPYARPQSGAIPRADDPDFEDDLPPWEAPQAVQAVSKASPAPALEAALRQAPLPRQEARPQPEAKPQPEARPKPETAQEARWAARRAAVQPTTAMSGDQFDIPDVKLPPRKRPEPRQLEMELPTPYTYPSLNLLKPPAPSRTEDRNTDAIRAQKLESTLESFRIPAQVKHVTHGPAIARFELELAAGINVSRVASIDKNIAMNLEVKSVRIEAPIPGKSLVGVEVPNREISSVTLREVLESPEMRRVESPLAVALGKDIAGQPVICDLEKMPHLLIAGATGSGKSVCINAIINSIIYRATPQQVRLILVDPKMVELQCYNCVPHLLVPVVSDPHKAAGALCWVVAEMMERYQRFKEHSVRNITGYNAALIEGEEPMARIVVIIDELADLMMTCKKDVEEYICRLAQLARAAGIHLVVATQRPSVDVITGLIKANIPSRIAFTVSSSIDSRTILDRVGAEKLLGRGDMLYLPNGEITPFRVQGCFLSDDEVNRVTDFIHRTSQVAFDPDILEKLDEAAAAGGSPAPDDAEPVDPGEGVDPLLAQAVELAVQDGQTSISMLQRRLRIGYSRAGRLVDEMTRRGILSQADGSKPRQVLITREDLEQMSLDEE